MMINDIWFMMILLLKEFILKRSEKLSYKSSIIVYWYRDVLIISIIVQKHVQNLLPFIEFAKWHIVISMIEREM